MVTLGDLLPPVGKRKKDATPVVARPAASAKPSGSKATPASAKAGSKARGGIASASAATAAAATNQANGSRRKRGLSVAFQLSSETEDLDLLSPAIDDAAEQQQLEAASLPGLACECDMPEREFGTQADLIITSSKELFDQYAAGYEARADASSVYPHVRYARLPGPMLLSSDAEDDVGPRASAATPVALAPGKEPTLSPSKHPYIADSSSLLSASLDEQDIQTYRTLMSRSLDPNDL